MNLNRYVPLRSVARHLIDQLAEWGCERIYGVAGDAVLDVLDELSRQGRIRYIACKHEGAAALMASAEAKLTGRPGVCLSTGGPGMACLLNGLADAAMDRAPVLAVTGQVERRKLGTGSKQDIDQQRLIDPLAAYSTLVADAAGFPAQLNIAWKEAVARGGVAHLSVPKDVWREQTEGPLFPPPPRILPPRPDEGEMVRAAELIVKAERPVILAGRGIEGGNDAVLRLAERIQAAVFVTMPVKGKIPEDHPWFAGGIGHAGSEAANRLVKQADLIIMLGATWWPEEFIPKQIPVVQVDVAAENTGRTHPCAVTVIGDASEVIARWLELAAPKRNEEWAVEVSRQKEEWRVRMEEETLKQKDALLTPPQAMAAIGRHVRPDAVIAVDTGDHTLWFERSFPLRGQDVLISGSWRTLGFALPAAMAAKLSFPDRQVAAVAGDGSFMTTMAELATAAQLRLPVTVFVLADGSYAMEKNSMLARGMAPLGVEFPIPDLVRLAGAFGLRGFRAGREGELDEAVREALACGEPSVVEIRCAGPPVPM